MSGRDVSHDIAVQFVLILFSISCHVIRVNEVTGHLIDGECFGETHSRVLVFCDGNDADFVGGFVWGETAFLLEGDGTGTIITDWRHDCGFLKSYWNRIWLGVSKMC